MQTQQLVRFEVDPNVTSKAHPGLYYCFYMGEDVSVGDEVAIVQPYDDEPDYVGRGKVAVIDLKRNLIYFNVDWESFKDE